MPPQPLLIFPCNGNGIEVLDCLGDAYTVVGFVDDTPEKQGRPVHGHKVFGREAFARWPEAKVIAVPGSPASFRDRRRIIEGLGLAPERFASVIHPAARVSTLATVGSNVLIMAGVVVTSNALIGNHVCILPNSVIHHDAKVGDWSLIGANVTLAGSAVLRDNCYVGSGSSIMNNVEIGELALVGLGSNVTKAVAPNAKVAGNPARQI